MIGRALGRVRIVTPRVRSIVLLVISFAIIEGLIRYFERPFGLAIPSSSRPSQLFLFLVAGSWGIRRATLFHPVYRPKYSRWLESTPWTVRLPLPMGPISLKPEDLPTMALLVGLATFLPEWQASIQVVNVFLFGYLMSITAIFWRTGVPAFGYAALFFLAFVPLVWPESWICLGLLAGVCLIVHQGIHRSLARFPRPIQGLRQGRDASQNDESASSTGWPYDRFIRDVVSPPRVYRGDAVLASMLTSLWLFSIVSSVWRDRPTQSMLLLGTLWLATPLVALIRLQIYRSGHASPISTWGRIRTLRWIIPGYDQIFIGPLATLIAAPLSVALLSVAGAPWSIALAGAVGIMLLVSLLCPPTLRHWRLTGDHRMVSTVAETSEEV